MSKDKSMSEDKPMNNKPMNEDTNSDKPMTLKEFEKYIESDEYMYEYMNNCACYTTENPPCRFCEMSLRELYEVYLDENGF